MENGEAELLEVTAVGSKVEGRQKRASAKRNALQRERVERWREICVDFNQSSKSASSYSREHSLNYDQLKYWDKKFQGAARGKSAEKFIEIKLPELPKPCSYKITLVNGIQIELGNGFRAEHLKQLIDILRC